MESLVLMLAASEVLIGIAKLPKSGSTGWPKWCPKVDIASRSGRSTAASAARSSLLIASGGGCADWGCSFIASGLLLILSLLRYPGYRAAYRGDLRRWLR